MTPELENLRKEIDRIDQALLTLFAERLRIAREMGVLKKKQNLEIYRPEREAILLADRKEKARLLGVPEIIIERVFQILLAESQKIQKESV